MKHGKIVTFLFPALVISCQIAKADSYTYTILQVPGSTSTQAYGINDEGQVVGTYSGGTGTGEFLYSNGSFTYFDAPSGFVPTGINNAGQIVGNSPYPYGAFLDNNGVFTAINSPSGGFASANGINNAGQIVGSYFASYNSSGYLRNPDGTYTILNVPSRAELALPELMTKAKLRATTTAAAMLLFTLYTAMVFTVFFTNLQVGLELHSWVRYPLTTLDNLQWATTS